MKPFPFSKIHLFFWVLILAGNSFFLCLAILAPLLRPGNPDLAASIYATFAPFCHQLPARCFWLRSYPLPLCGRCLGILSGFFLGTILYPLIKSLRSAHFPSARWLVFFSLPIALDTLGNLTLLWNTPTWPRFGLGLSWGIILPFYFFPAVARTWPDTAIDASSASWKKE
ncbi:MAG: DUF2085 domain-containing protein [Candidatus Aminicenantales bacterium]